MKIQLERYKGNPILKPTSNWWENRWVYNTGATIKDKKVILLYRARGDDHISRIGYAESEDGFNITKRLRKPVFGPEIGNIYEKLGTEDPRITKMGEEYYITYIALSLYSNYEKKPAFALKHELAWRARASIAKTKDFRNFTRLGIVLKNIDEKDFTLFPDRINGKYVAFHRKFPNLGLGYSKDLINWQVDDDILAPIPNSWEEERVGAGAPPIKTESGWLCFYHARDLKGIYRIGVALLDLKNPERVIKKLDYPILEPKEDYELTGQVPNVIFTCGAVEKEGKYFVYYGGADSVIGVATVDKDELLRVLI